MLKMEDVKEIKENNKIKAGDMKELKWQPKALRDENNSKKNENKEINELFVEDRTAVMQNKIKLKYGGGLRGGGVCINDNTTK